MAARDGAPSFVSLPAAVVDEPSFRELVAIAIPPEAEHHERARLMALLHAAYTDAAGDLEQASTSQHLLLEAPRVPADNPGASSGPLPDLGQHLDSDIGAAACAAACCGHCS